MASAMATQDPRDTRLPPLLERWCDLLGNRAGNRRGPRAGTPACEGPHTELCYLSTNLSISFGDPQNNSGRRRPCTRPFERQVPPSVSYTRSMNHRDAQRQSIRLCPWDQSNVWYCVKPFDSLCAPWRHQPLSGTRNPLHSRRPSMLADQNARYLPAKRGDPAPWWRFCIPEHEVQRQLLQHPALPNGPYPRRWKCPSPLPSTHRREVTLGTPPGEMPHLLEHWVPTSARRRPGWHWLNSHRPSDGLTSTPLSRAWHHISRDSPLAGSIHLARRYLDGKRYKLSLFPQLRPLFWTFLQCNYPLPWGRHLWHGSLVPAWPARS